MTKITDNDETYERIMNICQTIMEGVIMQDIWISYKTGEMRDDMVSLEELKKRQEKKENQLNGYRYAKKEMLPLPGFLQEEYGAFIHTRYNALLEKLNYDTATAFRFIYLCTYMNYDDGYIIWQGKKIDNGYLIDIFNVNQNSITKIKKKLYEEELIFRDKDGHIYINSDYCYKGDINNNKLYKKEYTRIFNDSIRELYNKTQDPREHKSLGRIILLLPYVNVYHNIICLNIKEKDMEKLILPNSEQMDIIFHTSHRNYIRLTEDLFKLSVNGEPVVLCINHKNARMYAINPKIYYGGTRLSDLKELSDYFKAKGGIN